MKLIDLLVQELPKRGGWPEVALNATQDKDGEVCFSSGATPEFGYAAWEGGDWCGNEFHTIRANDYDTAIITRAQYEAALAKNDGWVEWGGGECPVPENSLVEVKYRDGTIRDAYKASGYIWANGYGDNETTDSDIIAYRLHLDINSRSNDDQLEQDLNECIDQDIDVVNHPSHYTKGNIECIDAIESATTGKSGIEAVCVANIIKYLYRYEEKNGLEDVKKAKWYLNKLISELESN